MKLDIILYNNTAAIGLYYDLNLCNSPLIAFVVDSEEKLTDEDIAHYSSFGEFHQFNKELTVYLKSKYSSGDFLKFNDYLSISILYRQLIDAGLNLDKRDKNYYDLARWGENPFKFVILSYLRENLHGDNKEYYYKCAELLGDYNNGYGYRIQAYCYQEGIFVKKSRKPMYDLLKKAADCGDEQSIEWIKKEDQIREKRRKARLHSK